MNVITTMTKVLPQKFNLPAFKRNMSQEQAESWGSNDLSKIYMNLQNLMLDPLDTDVVSGRNFLHYTLTYDNPSVLEELAFRIKTVSGEDLLTLVNQPDKYGRKPLDYCKNPASRDAYKSVLEEAIGKKIGAASVEPDVNINDAIKANYMPSSPQPAEEAVTIPERSAAVQSEIVGNELASDAVIPESGDLDFDFDEAEEVKEEPVSKTTERPIKEPAGPASTAKPAAVAAAAEQPAAVEQPKAAEKTVAEPEKPVDTSENVPKADDSDFSFDQYKNDLAEDLKNPKNQPKNLDDVIGLDKVKALLRRDLIEPMKKENLGKLDNNNLNIENGFLFYGPPGCGKTFLITAIANELGLELQKVDDIKQLANIKEKSGAKFKAELKPTLVFVDNLDEKINPRTIDDCADLFSNCAQNGVILLAATNKYDDIDERAIRVGCFDQHIEIPLPQYQDRINIINYVLDKSKKDLNTQISEEDIEKLAKSTSGFSNAAIMYIVEKGIKDEVISGNGVLDINDFQNVIEEYAKSRKIGKLMDDNPTSVYDTFLKRSIIESPKDFTEVAGMKGVKEQLRESIVKRLEPETRKRFEDAKAPLFNDGFLFYGPPGCGKTFMVEALAGEAKLPLYKVDKAVYESSLKGDSVKNIRKIFDQLFRKFEATGEYSILFVDEADSIFPKRGTMGGYNDEEVNTMLQYLNNCTKKGVIPILATNFKDKIDEAITRTGRIGTHIEIPTPDFEARKELFKIALRDKEIAKNITDDNLVELANMLEGFASSDISHIAKNTIDKALIAGTEALSIDDFKAEIKTYAKERDLATDFSAVDKTTQYDKFKKRERIKYPRSFSDVAGMETTKNQLRTSIINKLNPEIRARFERNNMPLFNDGFMLYGKSGNGKTFIIEALAGEAQLPLYKVTKADYDTSLKGEAGNNIAKIFKQLENKFEKTGEYSLLFFDEADAIFPKRGTTGGNLNDEETNLMLQYLNNAPSKGIIPILATNYSEKIDPAILRSGRIGTHIEIPSPDFEARRAMFEMKIKGREITKHITDDDIASIARMLNGFCAADITHLTIATIEKAINDGVEELTIDDFKNAIKNFSNERGMPEVNELNTTSTYDTVLKRTQIKPKDPHSLDDIGGMKEAKEALLESVIVASNPEIVALNEENGIEPTNGVLLYGPPGCGKTFIMKAVAAQAKLPLYQMKMSDVGSSFVNQTSANMKAIFDQLRAKYQKTGEASILFLDECDTFFTRNDSGFGNQERNQDLNTLKEEMNNAGRDGIIIVAATNEIQNIDPSILRDGRFDTKVYIGHPDKEARFDIIQKDLKKRKLTNQFGENEDIINALVEASEGLATVSIVTAINDYVKKAIANVKDGKVKVSSKDLIEAMKTKVLKNEKLQKDIADRTIRL